MAFKIVFVLAALVACAQAGGPAAYSISAPSIDHASVGQSQEHTVKGHYGQSSQSDYSSQVTAGHAVSHVSRSSTTNDVGYAPSYGGHVVAQAAPIAHAIAAPAYVQSYGPAISHGYAAASPAILSHGYAASAPIISHGYAAAAPAISTGYYSPAPAYSHGVIAAPALYASAPATLKVAASPAYLSAGYGGGYGHGYVASAPAALKVAAAPAYLSAGYGGAYSHGYGGAYSHGYVASSPTAVKVASVPTVAYASHAPLTHGLGLGYAAAHYAAPAIAAPAIHAGPLLKAAVAAPALVHTSVAGHGIQYAY